jgi:ribosome maturation factor RimP
VVVAPLEVNPAVRAICQAVTDQEHVELVDVTFRKEGKRRILEVIFDAENGVDLELLTLVSQRISDELDVHDVVEGGSYLLEVSSAGLERPLVKPADFVRFTGREINVRTNNLIQDSKKFKGTIASAGESSFVLNVDSEAVEIPYTAVKKAELAVDWEAELKRANIDEGSTAGTRSRGGNE